MSLEVLDKKWNSWQSNKQSQQVTLLSQVFVEYSSSTSYPTGPSFQFPYSTPHWQIHHIYNTGIYIQGGHKLGAKILSFPAFFRAVNLLFYRLSQQRVNVIMAFIKGHDDPVYPVNSCFTQIFEWQTKNTLFVTIFPEDAQNSQNSLSFPCSDKSLSIPGFRGLWPPWCSMAYCYWCWMARQSMQPSQCSWPILAAWWQHAVPNQEHFGALMLLVGHLVCKNYATISGAH